MNTMDREEELFYRIENYLRDKMSEEDRNAFEAEMAADPQLAEAVDLQRFEQTSLEVLLEEDLTAKMAKWGQETAPPAKQAKSHFPRLWILLIAGAMLVGLYFLWKSTSGPENDSLMEEQEKAIPPATEDLPPAKVELDTTRAIATQETEEQPPVTKKNVVPDPPPQERQRGLSSQALALALYEERTPSHLQSSSTMRSGSTDQNDTSALIRGIELFEQALYQEAINTLEQIDSVQEEQTFRAAAEYLAHAYFQAKDFEKAAVFFRNIRDNSTIIVRERAEGYLMLSLLANYDQHQIEVDQLLESMTEDEYHDFHAVAVKAAAGLE